MSSHVNGNNYTESTDRTIKTEDGGVSPPKVPSFSELPDNVIVTILSHYPDINSIWKGPRGVSHRYRHLCEAPNVWEYAKVKLEKLGALQPDGFLLKDFPRLLRSTKSLELYGPFLANHDSLSMGALFGAIRDNAVSIQSLGLTGTSISDVTIFDFPVTLTHLHLDVEIPRYFFEPWLDTRFRRHFTALKCLRMRIRICSPEDLECLDTLAHLHHTITSLSISLETIRHPERKFDAIMTAIGGQLEHLTIGIVYFDFTEYLPTLFVKPIAEHCVKLQSLCIHNKCFRRDNDVSSEVICCLAGTSIGQTSSHTRNTLRHLTLSSNISLDFRSSLPDLKLLSGLQTLDIIGPCNNNHGEVRARLRSYLPHTTLKFYDYMKTSEMEILKVYPERRPVVLGPHH